MEDLSTNQVIVIGIMAFFNLGILWIVMRGDK